MLAKKILGTLPHSSHRILNLTLTGQKDDWQRALRFRDCILDVEPSQTGHL